MKREGMNAKTATGGLTKHSPPGTDKSMELRGGSVNDGAERGSVAKTPKTLGPREA